ASSAASIAITAALRVAGSIARRPSSSLSSFSAGNGEPGTCASRYSCSKLSPSLGSGPGGRSGDGGGAGSAAASASIGSGGASEKSTGEGASLGSSSTKPTLASVLRNRLIRPLPAPGGPGLPAPSRSTLMPKEFVPA